MDLRLKAFFSVAGVSALCLLSCHAHHVPQPPLEFSEDEAFEVNEMISKKLGYQLLRVAPGNYQVQFDREHRFGYVLLELEAAERDPEAAPPNGFGPRIRIASRKKNCQSGIGFRCGLVPAPTRIEASTDHLLVKMRVEADRVLRVEFRESVDWSSLEGDSSDRE